MNGRTDQDADELHRFASILNPASVIPLMHIGVSCPRHRDRESNIFGSPCSCSVSQYHFGRRARGHATQVLILSASTRERSSRRGMCRALRSTAAIALAYELSLAMRWVPSEINVADKPSQGGLRPFTKNRPHHPAARRHRHVAETRLAQGAPARRAFPSHPWNQIFSPPSCGHRRSGAQRRGIKSVPATTTAAGQKGAGIEPPCDIATFQEGRTSGSCRPNDPERLRAVAAPSCVPDAGDLRLHTACSANMNLGARHTNNP